MLTPWPRPPTKILFEPISSFGTADLFNECFVLLNANDDSNQKYFEDLISSNNLDFHSSGILKKSLNNIVYRLITQTIINSQEKLNINMSLNRNLIIQQFQKNIQNQRVCTWFLPAPLPFYWYSPILLESNFLRLPCIVSRPNFCFLYPKMQMDLP